VKAIDAKMSIDDNELFRRPEVAAMRDGSAEPWAEAKARDAGLSFVKLEGDVGCCVNGAGLAMATMDLVKYYGGRPANFLDIGGSSNPEKVIAALEIITADPNVKVILFNIFGGITRCDDVARGIVQATRRTAIEPPIVIRLTGTNEKEALAILKEAGFSAFTSMDEVVQKAVELAKTLPPRPAHVRVAPAKATSTRAKAKTTPSAGARAAKKRPTKAKPKAAKPKAAKNKTAKNKTAKNKTAKRKALERPARARKR
jgi:acyl-CoA synthetase (NDP forming)